MKNRIKEKNLRGPVSTLVLFICIIAIASFILNKIGFQGYQTTIANGVLTDTLVSVRNVLSVEGIRYIIGNTITNFGNFEPLVLLIVALIGIGICEKSGFLNALFHPLKRVKFGFIIYLTILISLISTIIGEYSYIFLIPFVGVMYKYLDRNPVLGIIITFLSITIGYGTGIVFNYNDYTLGLLTEAAATVDVDPNYTYSLVSNLYIMIVSTIVLSSVLYAVINHFLVPKFPRKTSIEDEELNDSKKGLALSIVSGLVCTGLVIYMIIDINLPGAGILLDHSSHTYIAKLFSEAAPFREGLVIIISFIMMITGFIYGKLSNNIKNSNEYSLGLSKNFENLGLVFVLMFFLSQLIAILDWTNIGSVLASNFITFISHLQFSGIFLIIVFFFVVILMSILIPDTLTKWELLSPVVIPLFMRSNITPAFTQFLFKIGDAVGKCISPIFIYFIIMIAFLQKYNTNENKQISIFGVWKTMLSTVLISTVFWIIFICLWFLIGIPIGPGIYTTL